MWRPPHSRLARGSHTRGHSALWWVAQRGRSPSLESRPPRSPLPKETSSWAMTRAPHKPRPPYSSRVRATSASGQRVRALYWTCLVLRRVSLMGVWLLGMAQVFPSLHIRLMGLLLAVQILAFGKTEFLHLISRMASLNLEFHRTIFIASRLQQTTIRLRIQVSIATLPGC